MSVSSNQIAEKEKKRVAFSSVVAAIFLTSIKLTVGILTNSLGILSEAAHSGLDLIAAGVTYFAVRISDQPPDRDHPYGHGKVENLSAFIETLLLLATCVWIIYEAVSRLIEPVHVEATIWSFAVMSTSIIVDISRSRALMRVAKKHNSQALEADALHFSTDVWSSSVVIVGLILVWLAPWIQEQTGIPVEWLNRADAIAALGVSGIVVYVSYKLGRKTINVLLDTAEKETIQKVEQVIDSIPGITSVKRLRVRHSGPTTFVDLTLDVPRSASFEEAHLIAMRVENAIEELIPRSDVMVNISPVVKDSQSLIEEIRSVAARGGVRVHGIRAHEVRGHLSLEMHIEVSETLTISEAHDQVSDFEDALYKRLTALEDIVTHIEPIGDIEIRRPTIRTSSIEVQNAIKGIVDNTPNVHNCHSYSIHHDGKELSVSFHCFVEPEMSVRDAHQLTIELESQIRKNFPELGRVVIHTEPYENQEDEIEEAQHFES